MRYGREGVMVSCGWNERLNTVPRPELPPRLAVPYRVLLDKINPATGVAPSLPPVKLNRFVNLVPSVFTANTVPLPELPPTCAVPYNVLADKINLADGLAPSLLVLEIKPVKIYRVVKPVPSVLMANTVPLPDVPPLRVVPYSILPERTNPACGRYPPLLVVKLCRFVNPVPSVLTANTVPKPELPPRFAVP